MRHILYYIFVIFDGLQMTLDYRMTDVYFRPYTLNNTLCIVIVGVVSDFYWSIMQEKTIGHPLI